MGIAYKLYEKAAYWLLDWGYEGGKEIDRAREKKERDEAYRYIRGRINYDNIDKNFDNLLQEAKDTFGNNNQAKRARHYE